MSSYARRDDLRQRHRLPRIGDSYQVVYVERQRNGTAQTDMLLAHAADYGIVEVEIRIPDIGLRQWIALDARRRVFLLEFAIGQQPVRDLSCQLDVVEMPLLKLQQPRLHFFDDADVDNAHLGQAFGCHAAYKCRVRRIAAFRELEEPIIWIGLENDSRAALPLPETIRTGANGASANVAACRFDNFSCHREDDGQILFDDGIVGLVEPKL